MTKLIPKQALESFGQSSVMQKIAPKLEDIAGERLESMDENGITMQVLSVDCKRRVTLTTSRRFIDSIFAETI